MKYFKKFSRQLRGSAVVLGVSFALPLISLRAVAAEHEPQPLRVPEAVLQSVMDLYGLDVEAASDRIEREEKAAESWFRVRRAPLKGYAGAWFDGQSLRVATNDSSDSKLISERGASALIVSHSLAALESSRNEAHARLQGQIVSSHIDYRQNRIVLGFNEATAHPSAVAAALRLQIQNVGLDPTLFLIVATPVSVPSSNTIRGGDPTRNKTFDDLQVPSQTYPSDDNVYPCSVGAAVEDGYITAGHCGYDGDDIYSKQGGYDSHLTAIQAAEDENPPRRICIQPTDIEDDPTVPLGEVESSLFDANATYSLDSGWVIAGSGWSPEPKINGYSAGVINVPASWSGMLESPLGATVCRYGQSSGGPHCGTITAVDLDLYFASTIIEGVTQVTGSCTVDGDSGGPFLSASGQVQGTNYGGPCPHICSEPPEEYDRIVNFQPIGGSLAAFGKTLLTAHGANAPTAGLICTGMYGQFTCGLASYNSQGETTWVWSSNVGSSGTDALYTRSCTPTSAVNVQLNIQNPYGSTVEYRNFSCPTEAVIFP